MFIFVLIWFPVEVILGTNADKAALLAFLLLVKFVQRPSMCACVPVIAPVISCRSLSTSLCSLPLLHTRMQLNVIMVHSETLLNFSFWLKPKTVRKFPRQPLIPSTLIYYILFTSLHLIPVYTLQPQSWFNPSERVTISCTRKPLKRVATHPVCFWDFARQHVVHI